MYVLVIFQHIKKTRRSRNFLVKQFAGKEKSVTFASAYRERLSSKKEI
jgi:hypothetical protein